MDQPRISVVIPVRDDVDHLRRALELLAAQTVVPDEIVVVDDGSSDDSADVARAAGARVVTHGGRGIPASTAAGFDAATGGILARIDADSRPGPDWVAGVIRAFDDPSVGAVTGPGRFDELGPVARRLAGLLYMDAYFVLVGSALAHWPLFGSNCAVRRSVWESVSGEVHRDDPYLHDDMDLSIHIGLRHRIVLDRTLALGISARPFGADAGMARRLDRGVQTLRRHPGLGSSLQRWSYRVRAAPLRRRALGSRRG